MPLNDTMVGRTLASPVLDPRGSVLLHAGVVLTDRHLATLRTRGIEALDLQSDAPPAHDPIPPLDAACHAAIEAALDARFRQSNRDHPAVDALFFLCRQQARDLR
jgi:hypothetical protein